MGKRGASMRLPNWEEKLGKYIASMERKDFRYGVLDCCRFAAGAVEAIAGKNLMEEVPRYFGVQEARRLLKSLGGLEMAAETITLGFGLREVEPLKAQRGDMVLAYLASGRPCMGVVSPNGWHCIFPALHGLARIPLRECARAWRVE